MCKNYISFLHIVSIACKGDDMKSSESDILEKMKKNVVEHTTLLIRIGRIKAIAKEFNDK